jgi:hypothetical protein
MADGSEDMNGPLRMKKGAEPLHEGINNYSVSCSFSREDPISPGELSRFAGSLMKNISEECFSRGAVDIGHIKAYIEHEHGFLSADTLGDPSDVFVEGTGGKPVSGFRLVVNAVVFGLSADLIGKATEGSIDSLSREFGFARKHSGNNL